MAFLPDVFARRCTPSIRTKKSRPEHSGRFLMIFDDRSLKRVLHTEVRLQIVVLWTVDDIVAALAKQSDMGSETVLKTGSEIPKTRLSELLLWRNLSLTKFPKLSPETKTPPMPAYP